MDGLSQFFSWRKFGPFTASWNAIASGTLTLTVIEWKELAFILQLQGYFYKDTWRTKGEERSNKTHHWIEQALTTTKKTLIKSDKAWKLEFVCRWVAKLYKVWQLYALKCISTEVSWLWQSMTLCELLLYSVLISRLLIRRQITVS